MMILIAAALAAAAPSAPAQPGDAHAQRHEMGQHEQHNDKDCCKDCCKDMMSKMHEGHGDQAGPQQAGHSGR